LHGGSNVHGSGIDTDKQLRTGTECRQLLERELSRKIGDLRAGALVDLGYQFELPFIGRRGEYNALSTPGQRVDEFRCTFWRPALELPA
jgi:hypothetical protein